jgi:hypothetical protein
MSWVLLSEVVDLMKKLLSPDSSREMDEGQALNHCYYPQGPSRLD